MTDDFAELKEITMMRVSYLVTPAFPVVLLYTFFLTALGFAIPSGFTSNIPQIKIFTQHSVTHRYECSQVSRYFPKLFFTELHSSLPFKHL